MRCKLVVARLFRIAGSFGLCMHMAQTVGLVCVCFFGMGVFGDHPCRRGQLARHHIHGHHIACPAAQRHESDHEDKEQTAHEMNCESVPAQAGG